MNAEQGSVVFDRAADFYDATRGYPRGVAARVAARIAEAGGLGSTSRLLEVGVGTGRIALPLAACVGEVVGLDLSIPMLRNLVAKRGAEGVAVLRGDATRLPFPTACFDAVLGVHFFHLVPLWREALAEVARVLRPGAPLLLGADDPNDSWASLRNESEAVAKVEHVGVPRGRFFDFPLDEGWRPTGEPLQVAFTRRLRPRVYLERIEQRIWSHTWRMSDAEIARTVAALRPQLVAQYGDLDAEVDVPGGFSVRGWVAPSRAE
jgi:SAM-dependent methyltransferase